MHTLSSREPRKPGGILRIATIIFCVLACAAFFASEPRGIAGADGRSIAVKVSAAAVRAAGAKAAAVEARESSRERPARPTCAASGGRDETFGCGVGANLASGVTNPAFAQTQLRLQPA